MKTFNFAVLLIQHTLVLLIPVSHAHCFVDFSGECSKRYKTIAEDVGLVDVRGLPGLPLRTSHMVPWVPNLSRMHVVNRFGGSVLYPLLHCHWTSTIFSILQYHFKIAFCCSNDNLVSILILLINLLHSYASMTYVSLIVYRTSYYSLLLFFSPTLKYIKQISPVKVCVHFFGTARKKLQLPQGRVHYITNCCDR